MDDKLANPAPLGLMGFGMTTVLLNIHNAGFFGIEPMILAMGIFYGGIAQIIAGILEYKKNNTFGLTAFTSYGCFWLTLVFIWIAPHLGWWENTGSNTKAFTAYLAIWGCFTFFMFIATLKKNRALQFIFLSLTVLFWLLAIEYGFKVVGNVEMAKTFATIAGFEGIVCGLSAIYLAMAEVINESYGKEILPIGA